MRGSGGSCAEDWCRTGWGITIFIHFFYRNHQNRINSLHEFCGIFGLKSLKYWIWGSNPSRNPTQNHSPNLAQLHHDHVCTTAAATRGRVARWGKESQQTSGRPRRPGWAEPGQGHDSPVIWRVAQIEWLVGGDWNMFISFFHSVGKFIIPPESHHIFQKVYHQPDGF